MKQIINYLGTVTKSLGKVKFEIQDEEQNQSTSDETENKKEKIKKISFKKQMAQYGPNHPNKTRILTLYYIHYTVYRL